jgi:hypothetical protein
MAGDIVLQLRDARYPGQLEMRLAAADEIELLRSKCQVAAIGQADFNILLGLVDITAGQTREALRRILAVLPYESAPRPSHARKPQP